MVDVMANSARGRASPRGSSTSNAPARTGSDNEWTVADAERISSVENIYRVSLSAASSTPRAI
jgi:hypothetical protein